MRLGQVIESVPAEFADVEIGALAYDSRRVAAGTLFFCVPGFASDGHRFASTAVDRGAVALVVERPLGLGVPEVLVEDARAEMAPAAARFHGHPSRSLGVVGVTGTNGKTTTTFLVRSLLEASGCRCALLGTVKSVVGGREEPVARTTPEAIDLQAVLAEMVRAGDRCCAMEVSSHALALGRAEAIDFAVAVFTNLTQDHLDFHPTMEDYFQAKRRLFEGDARAVVNIDDPYGRRLAGERDRVITYGLEHDADFRALDVRSHAGGAEFELAAGGRTLSARLPLPGRFNVSNALAALAAGDVLGLELDTMVEHLAGVEAVPGRLQPVLEGQEFAVLVDYAHTPDSLENVLLAARDLTAGRVVCVFGCGGDRDRGKRPLMGEIASRLADRVLVTSDNPRSEEPEAIIREILAGVRGGEVEALPDRREAIARAIGEGRPGDVVLIAGKGHEQGQEFADGRRVPFDDVQVAREALRRRGQVPAGGRT